MATKVHLDTTIGGGARFSTVAELRALLGKAGSVSVCIVSGPRPGYRFPVTKQAARHFVKGLAAEWIIEGNYTVNESRKYTGQSEPDEAGRSQATYTYGLTYDVTIDGSQR